MASTRLVGALWRLFANCCGILAVAGVIAYGLMRAFSGDGPVVEVTKGPPRGVIYASYHGTIKYEVTTVRHESCPGTVRVEYRRAGEFADSDLDGHVISSFWPVMSSEMRPEMTTLVERMLPDSVYPGRWLYRHTVSSRCPLRERTDVIAEFSLEVVPTAPKE